MKFRLGLLLLLTAVLAVVVSNKLWTEDKDVKYLHHVVGFKFRPGAPLDSIREDAYNTLGKLKIYEAPFSYNDNVPNSFDQQFTGGVQHVLHLVFKNEYDRDSIYIPSELHLKFIKKWKAQLEQLTVIDWWE